MGKKRRDVIEEKKGFTLIEIIISTGVIFILLAAGSYFFKRAIASSNLTSFCELLYSDILTSQQIAISDGKNHIISFEKNGYSIFKEDEKNIVVRKTPPYVEIKKTTFTKKVPGKNTLLFFANTGAPSQGGTVVVENSMGDKKCVVVSYYIGRVRISEDCE